MGSPQPALQMPQALFWSRLSGWCSALREQYTPGLWRGHSGAVWHLGNFRPLNQFSSSVYWGENNMPPLPSGWLEALTGGWWEHVVPGLAQTQAPMVGCPGPGALPDHYTESPTELSLSQDSTPQRTRPKLKA